MGQSCQARINRHEFQAAYDRRSLLKLGEIVESQREELPCARAEEVQQRDQQLLQGQVIAAKFWNYVKLIRNVSQKMEELRKFQCSNFDTVARGRLIEYQDTISELTGKIQQLQNEIYCMNDSNDFQDTESIRSGKFRRYQSTSFIPTSPNS